MIVSSDAQCSHRKSSSVSEDFTHRISNELPPSGVGCVGLEDVGAGAGVGVAAMAARTASSFA